MQKIEPFPILEEGPGKPGKEKRLIVSKEEAHQLGVHRRNRKRKKKIVEKSRKRNRR